MQSCNFVCVSSDLYLKCETNHICLLRQSCAIAIVLSIFFTKYLDGWTVPTGINSRPTDQCGDWSLLTPQRATNLVTAARLVIIDHVSSKQPTCLARRKNILACHLNVPFWIGWDLGYHPHLEPALHYQQHLVPLPARAARGSTLTSNRILLSY